MIEAGSSAQELSMMMELSAEKIENLDNNQILLLYRETGDEKLKWELVLRCESLVRSIALQICGVYSSFAQVDDIVNEGIITLMGAVDKFDVDMGVKFETYVSKRIRGMIIDLARRQDWVPRSVRKRAKEIDRAITELYEQLGRYPKEEEVANALGLSKEKYLEGLVNVNMCNVMSLEALMDGMTTGSGGLNLPAYGTASQPEQHLQEEELHQMLAAGIQSLRENEQMVLSLYYEKEMNMREIAQVLNVSEPRISQIHSRAIQKMRFFLEKYENGG